MHEYEKAVSTARKLANTFLRIDVVREPQYVLPLAFILTGTCMAGAAIVARSATQPDIAWDRAQREQEMEPYEQVTKWPRLRSPQMSEEKVFAKATEEAKAKAKVESETYGQSFKYGHEGSTEHKLEEKTQED